MFTPCEKFVHPMLLFSFFLAYIMTSCQLCKLCGVKIMKEYVKKMREAAATAY